jgi:RHS repeat-associated protein
VDYQPKASSKHACRHLRRHVSHRTTRYQPTTLTWTASYDSRDRLTALVRSNTSSRYQYDANSNRLTSVAQTIADTNGNASFEALDTAANTAQALAVDATSNRLLGFTQSLTSVRGTQTLSTVNSAVNYSLDAAGNLSSDGLRAFGYDATNRHTSTRSPAGADTATVQYLFNALGQRVFKSVVALSSGTGVVSGATNTTGSITPMPTLGQFYSYADDSEGSGNSSSGSSASLPSYAMLGEYCNGASGCVQQEYLWLPLDNGQAIPVGLLRSSRLYAIHTDHLGTPRLIHDDSNTPVWQWAYSAFGENAPTGALKATTNVNAVFALGANNAKLAVSAPGITVNLRFAGQYADSESNLFQNGFRSYAPAIGSYSQMDPIGLSGGLNRRGYVSGNTFGATDPLGLWTWKDAWTKGKKSGETAYEVWDVISGKKSSQKNACLCGAISKRKQAYEELLQKGYRGIPLTSWDQAALSYLDQQRKADALTAMKIGFEIGSDTYSSIGSSGGLGGLPAAVGVTIGVSSTPLGYDQSAHATGRGAWTVSTNDECEE